MTNLQNPLSDISNKTGISDLVVAASRVSPSSKQNNEIYRDPLIEIVTKESLLGDNNKDYSALQKMLEENHIDNFDLLRNIEKAKLNYHGETDDVDEASELNSNNLFKNLEKNKLKYWQLNHKKLQRLLIASTKEIENQLESYHRTLEYPTDLSKHNNPNYSVVSDTAELIEMKHIYTSEAFARKMKKMTLDLIRMQKYYDKKQRVFVEQVQRSSEGLNTELSEEEMLEQMLINNNKLKEMINYHEIKYDQLNWFGKIVESLQNIFGQGLRGIIQSAKIKFMKDNATYLELQTDISELLLLRYEMNSMDRAIHLYNNLLRNQENQFFKE